MGLHCGISATDSLRSCVPTYGEDSTGLSMQQQYTIVNLDADEATPLLVHQWPMQSKYSSVSSSRANIVGVISSQSTINSYQPKLPFFEFRLLAITFILVAGMTIATYLLILETSLPSIGFSLDLVDHDSWSRMNLTLGRALNHSHVVNVMVMQTGGDRCDDTEACLRLLEEMQASQSQLTNRTEEIPYNFLIGGDGLTYEVRGWDYECGLDLPVKDSTLVLGFIGNYSETAPNAVQLHSAHSLIRESVRRRKLQRHYQVYALRTAGGSAALATKISTWPHYLRTLQLEDMASELPTHTQLYL